MPDGAQMVLVTSPDPRFYKVRHAGILWTPKQQPLKICTFKFLDSSRLDLTICLVVCLGSLNALLVVGRSPGKRGVIGCATWTCGRGRNWRVVKQASSQISILTSQRFGTTGTDLQVAYISIEEHSHQNMSGKLLLFTPRNRMLSWSMIHRSFECYSYFLRSVMDRSFECYPKVADALQDPPDPADGVAYRGSF
jgi:hypothetical protein